VRSGTERTGRRPPRSDGAQVAAEAMPYHSERRTDCNTGRRDPGVAAEREIARPRAVSGAGAIPVEARPGTGRHGTSPFNEVEPVGVEYLVRTARITDIDRLVTLSDAARGTERADSPMNAADLLRQLVYLPQASIFIAEARREVVGGAVLALRPSVRAGGYVGTVDLLVVDPDHDADRITSALIEELVRSASNKGCTVVEAARPNDPAERTRWERQGFSESGPLMERSVAAVGAAARRT
jgi:GNAT superfamily N-acetyltransferase